MLHFHAVVSIINVELRSLEVCRRRYSLPTISSRIRMSRSLSMMRILDLELSDKAGIRSYSSNQYAGTDAWLPMIRDRAPWANGWHARADRLPPACRRRASKEFSRWVGGGELVIFRAFFCRLANQCSGVGSRYKATVPGLVDSHHPT
jgi:hypothetical protein